MNQRSDRRTIHADEPRVVTALVLLMLGLTAIAVLDPVAARRGEASLFFERLHPFQRPLAVLGLAALLAHRLLA